jgi:hypothetical protein
VCAAGPVAPGAILDSPQFTGVPPITGQVDIFLRQKYLLIELGRYRSTKS